MTNSNTEPRELKIEELDLVSGGKPNTESGVKGISASGRVFTISQLLQLVVTPNITWYSSLLAKAKFQ